MYLVKQMQLCNALGMLSVGNVNHTHAIHILKQVKRKIVFMIKTKICRKMLILV